MKKVHMISQECSECSGTGRVVILNAYDDKYREETECDYCGGAGSFLVPYEVSGEIEDGLPN